MTSYRFEVGTTVLCNLGELGWKQGRIIAHNYREDPWPEGMFAPYQVVLEDDRSLIELTQSTLAGWKTHRPTLPRMECSKERPLSALRI